MPKMNFPLTKQSRRDAAHLMKSAQQCFRDRESWVMWITEAAILTIRFASVSLNRYPSPHRPVCSPSRPITDSCHRATKKWSDIGYHAEIAIDELAVRANSGATEKTTIGLRLCKRHQSSSRQWQYLVWLVALRATLSAALLAQVLDLWQQKFSAQIAQVQCLLVQPQACFATTQASTAVNNNDIRALFGRINFGNRRRGITPAAVF